MSLGAASISRAAGNPAVGLFDRVNHCPYASENVALCKPGIMHSSRLRSRQGRVHSASTGGKTACWTAASLSGCAERSRRSRSSRVKFGTTFTL